jgi:hydroxyacylglutathione hydrolase
VRGFGVETSLWAAGQMPIEPVFTPDHTPGSARYLIGENMFTGDVPFAEGGGARPGPEAAAREYLSAVFQ